MGEGEFFHVHRVSDFDVGRQFALMLLVFAGLPLAPLAAIAGLATIRRAPRRWSPIAGAAFRGAFYLQVASLAVTGPLLVTFCSVGGTEALGEPSVYFLAASVAASAAALPGWRSAVLASRDTPISILEPEGGCRFRQGSDLR